MTQSSGDPSGSGAASAPEVIARWWHAAESGSAVDGPPHGATLAAALGASMALRTAEARALLAKIDPSTLEAPWRRVWRLLDLELVVRARDPAAEAPLRALVDDAGAARESSTAGRAWHALATMHLRNNRFEEAERASIEALRLVLPEGSLRTSWIADGYGQVCAAQGAWHEARRTYEAVARTKEARGDDIGIAISLGNAAALDLQLCEPARAEATLQRALGRPSLPAASRLRLGQHLLVAQLEAGALDRAAKQRDVLAATFDEASDAPGTVRGYAAIALAREAAARGDRPAIERWLGSASRDLPATEQTAARYWTVALLRPDDDAAIRDLCASNEAAPIASETEILARLHAAKRARSPIEAERWLDSAYARAVAANQPAWIERIDRVCAEIDPRRLAERLVERFTGRSSREMARTTTEVATIVFADLVGFSPRALVLSPEEVMATVRSFFELAVPLLSRWRVRPLSCLGDGLLAISEGDAHAERGLAFARRLVEKAMRATFVRTRVLGEPHGLDLRAGVASGRVVTGAVGSLLKLEYAAIGATTNLAARLQGAAVPGEIVCAAESAGAAANEGVPDAVKLKGFDAPTQVIRFRAAI